MDDRPAYFIFDIETVADGRLIQRVRYPGDPQLTAAEAVARQRAELMAAKGTDFIPLNFQVPVSVAICVADADFRLQRIATLDRPDFRPQVITRKFWQGWRHFGRPCFVSFNGRCFDVPVMELSAFRYGIPLGGWMTEHAKSWEDPRNRYNDSSHIDLQDLLGNFGAVWMHGGLDLLATLLGKPGKMDTKGHMVQDLWEAGEHIRIDDYCQCDALDTYFVFLRSRVLLGRISIEQEQALVEEARALIAQRAEEVPALGDYLENFSLWRDPGDEGWPFVGSPDPSSGTEGSEDPVDASPS